jgi:hypothetical protein
VDEYELKQLLHQHLSPIAGRERKELLAKFVVDINLPHHEPRDYINAQKVTRIGSLAYSERSILKHGQSQLRGGSTSVMAVNRQ